MFKVGVPCFGTLIIIFCSFEQPRNTCEIKKKMKQGEVKENLSSPYGKIKDAEKGIQGWNNCNFFQAGEMSKESKQTMLYGCFSRK